MFSRFCSANLEKIKVHPNIYVLAVRLLGRNERYAELGQFVLNKVFYFENEKLRKCPVNEIPKLPLVCTDYRAIKRGSA